jgi:hypothetical protein
MGQTIKIVSSDCIIINENRNAIFNIWQGLNNPLNNSLKDGGKWANGTRISYHYSCMDQYYDQTCITVEDVLDCLRFDYLVTDDNDILIVGFDAKPGAEELFFTKVSHLLHGSIQWEAFEGGWWTWNYN